MLVQCIALYVGLVRLVEKPAGFHCVWMKNTVHTIINSSKFIQIPPSEQSHSVYSLHLNI